jgi:hypothetical protein
MSIGPTEPGEIGLFYEFVDTAFVGSIDLEIDNTAKNMSGYPAFVYLREFGTEPGAIIDSTEKILVTDSTIHIFRLEFDEPVKLPPGKYFFSSVEPASTLNHIVSSDQLFSEKACWASFASSPLGLWGAIEDFGLFLVCHIRVNLASPPPPVGLSDGSLLPDEYSMSQNYPNPFNPTTTINYALPEESKVVIKLYDILGADVAVLVDENKKAGYHKLNFNAAELSSGVYFYRIKAGSFIDTKKFVLLK